MEIHIEQEYIERLLTLLDWEMVKVHVDYDDDLAIQALRQAYEKAQEK